MTVIVGLIIRAFLTLNGKRRKRMKVTSKRTLTRWRKEALITLKEINGIPFGASQQKLLEAFCGYTLTLTQELSDLRLLEENKNE